MKAHIFLVANPEFQLQILCCFGDMTIKCEVKGALDKFNIIPQLFPKKVGIFIPLEELAWVITACQVLH